MTHITQAVIDRAASLIKDGTIRSVSFGKSATDHEFFTTLTRTGHNSINAHGPDLALCLYDALNQIDAPSALSVPPMPEPRVVPVTHMELPGLTTRGLPGL